jgi:hypothetical protein
VYGVYWSHINVVRIASWIFLSDTVTNFSNSMQNGEFIYQQSVVHSLWHKSMLCGTAPIALQLLPYSIRRHDMMANGALYI